MSLIILNLSETGGGKSFRTVMFADEYKEKTPFVVDPAKQYLEYTHIKQIDPKIDIRIPLQRIKNGLIIVDEAQIYFPPAASNKELVIALSQCRHNRTVTILNFHSLRQVPIYILDYLNLIILGHTNDNFEAAKRYANRSGKIVAAMIELQKIKNEKPFATVLID